jgi:hypothetical protein
MLRFYFGSWKYAMASFWCRLFDTGGRVVGAEKLEAEDDIAVVAKAQLRFAQSGASAYEIWDRDRLVQRVLRPLSA